MNLNLWPSDVPISHHQYALPMSDVSRFASSAQVALFSSLTFASAWDASISVKQSQWEFVGTSCLHSTHFVGSDVQPTLWTEIMVWLSFFLMLQLVILWLVVLVWLLLQDALKVSWLFWLNLETAICLVNFPISPKYPSHTLMGSLLLSKDLQRSFLHGVWKEHWRAHRWFHLHQWFFCVHLGSCVGQAFVPIFKRRTSNSTAFVPRVLPCYLRCGIYNFGGRLSTKSCWRLTGRRAKSCHAHRLQHMPLGMQMRKSGDFMSSSASSPSSHSRLQWTHMDSMSSALHPLDTRLLHAATVTRQRSLCIALYIHDGALDYRICASWQEVLWSKRTWNDCLNHGVQACWHWSCLLTSFHESSQSLDFCVLSALGQGLCCLECKMRMSLFLLEGFQLNQLIRSTRFSLRHSLFSIVLLRGLSLSPKVFVSEVHCLRLLEVRGCTKQPQGEKGRIRGQNCHQMVELALHGGLSDHMAILAIPSLLELFTLRIACYRCYGGSVCFRAFLVVWFFRLVNV